MLQFNNIKIKDKSQEYKIKSYIRNEGKNKSVVVIEKKETTSKIKCPKCNGKVHICDENQVKLKDMPIYSNEELSILCIGKRYQCQLCKHTFQTENLIKYPGTRITKRAANWIKSLLINKLSIKAIQNITKIHWETIKKIQCEIMEKELNNRQKELEKQNYKPKIIAIDEFAIRKGHKYATCVMDLETGEIIWVGEGRSMKDFEKFFTEINPSLITNIIAVAMDMNASYNKLVRKYLPNADIVYDRYHMQSQYGRDVLGVVRLNEAQNHKNKVKELSEELNQITDKKEKVKLKKYIKAEKSEYKSIKQSRWSLLLNGKNIKEERKEKLNEILSNHHDLAVCYSMKEEMCRLFELDNYSEASVGWKNWFEAAKASNIPALVKFALRKEKRIDGLINHSVHNISTGKLEGFNNKIKVAKRIGYGYRDVGYFFILIRYLSLSSVRRSHIFP